MSIWCSVRKACYDALASGKPRSQVLRQMEGQVEDMETPAYVTLIPLFDDLRGERVVIRPYQNADAETLYNAIVESRDHLARWLPWVAQYRRVEDARDFVVRCQAEWLLRQAVNLGIWDAHSGDFLGGIGLRVRDWAVPYFEIGYWLRQRAEGYGYVGESVRLLTDFAFEHLHAQRVEIRCDARNSRSASVARRLGFVQEAHLRHAGLAGDGVLRDTFIFALTPTDSRWPT